MSNQPKIQITIFQAPYASLMEHGLYLKMHDMDHPFQGTIPAEYYLPVFNGEIDCPDSLPGDPEARALSILERVFYIFNQERPAGYCGRSLSVGDVVKLEDRYYLCGAIGFTAVSFETSQGMYAGQLDPPFCQLTLPSGLVVRATAEGKSEYPSVTISLLSSGEESEQLCFVEHNPDKPAGKELCIGAYCSSEEDTVYYDSYFKDGKDDGHGVLE